MISFIVPAHNEEACLGQTLRAIHEAARATGQPYEIIVVDDASTDATVEIARQSQATVVPVQHRQISATRNSGGRVARGDRLIFVDADTTANPRAVAAALDAMEKGAVGGGGPTWFDGFGSKPVYIRAMGFLAILLTKIAGFTGGAFMFCTREAFQATGGFSERLYWAEEGGFALALKREGRFVVLWEPVLTSPRRFRTLSGVKVVGMFMRLISSPRHIFTRRASVEKIWYDSNREADATTAPTWADRICNALIMLIFFVLVTRPIWDFAPWAWTPLSGLLGKARFGIEIVLCHVGLILWPFGLILLVSLLRQKRWTSVLHTLALIAFLGWNAWGATNGVLRLWATSIRWVMN